MVPREYFTTFDDLFDGMSSEAEEEDWSAIRKHNRKIRKRGSHERVLETEVDLAQTSDAKDVGSREEPTRKKPKLDISSKATESSHGQLSPMNCGYPVISVAPDSSSNTDFVANPEVIPVIRGISPAFENGKRTGVLTTSPPLAVERGDNTGPVAPSSSTEKRDVSGSISSPSPEPTRQIRRGATTDEISRTTTRDIILQRSATDNHATKLMSRKRRGRRTGGDGTGQPKKLSYFELAIDLMSRLSELTTKSQVLRGVSIFMIAPEQPKSGATEQTKGRLELVLKHGGTVQPSFDVIKTTHIICELSKPQKREMKLRLNGMSVDEVPYTIPILSWKWVADCIRAGRLADQRKEELFVTRINVQLAKEHERAGNNSRRASRGGSPIEDFDLSQETQERPGRVTPEPDTQAAPMSSLPKGKVDENDPLAPFYESARYGHDAVDLDDESSEAPSSPSPSKSRPMRPLHKGFACNDLSGSRGTGINDDIIAKLQELLRIHEVGRKDDDRWKVMTYRKAIGSLRRSYKRITTIEEARCLPGIGQKTAEKIIEIVQTGDLQRLKFEKTGEYQVCEVLRGIYGVGSKTAYLWYKQGVRTLEDVRQRKGGITLTEPQQIGLDHYDDLQRRMPRSEASAIFDNIRNAVYTIDPLIQIELMGSYRRGSADCGDIDLLFTRPTDDGRTHKGVLPRLLRLLSQQGLITHTLAEPDFSGDGLEAKFMGLCRLEESTPHRCIDILTVPIESWGAALIYFTGDDIFNRSMRLLAKRKEYSLNQRGLWKDVLHDPNSKLKVTEGTLVASRTEEEIFAILGVPWQLPHQRVRSD